MAVGSISSLGVGSGLQLQDILDQLREADSQPITMKEAEVTELTAQLDEFTVVNNKLLTMKSSALTLSLAGTFLGRSGSSSSESVLSVAVADATAVQSTSVTVGRLATKSSFLSEGFASKTASVTAAAATLTIQIGTKSTDITVAAGTTLEGLVSKINSATGNPGVTAKLVDTGEAVNPYKISIQANTVGADNYITINENLDAISLTRQEAAAADLNAKLTVDGIDYYRKSNTVSDVLSGVTMTLNATGTSTVGVAADEAGIVDKITEFVNAYNEAVQEIDSKVSYDSETEEFGVLARTTVRDLPYGLQNLMTASMPTNYDFVTTATDANGKAITVDNNIYTMFDLGLAYNRDGTISIDSSVLSAAVADNIEAVQYFFLGDSEEGITGLADQVNDYLRELTGGAGQIEGEKTAAQGKISALEAQIEADTERLTKKYDLLARRFVELDTYMNQMTSMSNYLAGQFDSLGKVTSGSKG